MSAELGDPGVNDDLLSLIRHFWSVAAVVKEPCVADRDSAIRHSPFANRSCY